MGRMTEAAKSREELAKREPQGITPQQRLIQQFQKAWPRMADAASNAISKDRMYQLIVSTINRNPKLAECTPETVLSCFMRCTTLGLEPSDVDGLGRAYILPFYNGKKRHMEATFIIGYKGLIDLARRSGKIKDISARAVYEGDDFDFEFGLDERLRHVPKATEKTPDKLTHVYCIVHFTDGGHFMEVMTKSEIEAVRKRSKAANSGPWVSDYEAMAKKTVIRRSQPYLPLSTQAAKAVSMDDTDGGFTDILVTKPLIDDTVMIVDNGQSEGLTVTIDDQADQATLDGINSNGNNSLVNTVADNLQMATAACQTCGEVREVAPGQSKEQLDMFLCCENPDYQYV